ncbi:MAG: methionyl-tRNA formyltransferase [Clostridiales bacterium]|nr:methionyl-tRNA formyltransferase [Clostridiales bacterium]
MRIVFMGTPDFAVPSLDALAENGYEIVGVITQPDRPAGRGHKLVPPPVKARALELGIPVFQFERLRAQEGYDCLCALEPDVVVTAAFGQILSKRLLAVPKFGTVNVHASLLPRHRGAAPINWAIILGDKVAGVTTMLTDAGVDTGAMLLKAETPIGEEEDAGQLTERLSHMGADLLIETLKNLDSITPVPQNEAEMTHEPMLSREIGEIDFNKPAQEIINLVRGVTPWPGARCGALKVYRVRSAEGSGEAGVVLRADAKGGLIVACADGAVELVEIQAPNAKRMEARAYLLGKRITVGERLNI